MNEYVSVLTLLVGWQEGHPWKKTEWWSAGVVICLEWLGVQTCIRPSWCHCHSLSLASVKSRLVLPFWYRLTWVVADNGPLNVCSSMLLPETDTSVLPMVSCWWYLLKELSGRLKSTGRDQYQRVLLSTPQVQALQHLPGYSAGISVRQLRLHCTNTIQYATLTCTRKPTWVSLIYRMETTVKK